MTEYWSQQNFVLSQNRLLLLYIKLKDLSIVPMQEALSHWQQVGLNWVALWQGRDVVLAIDLTESVGFNDPGRVRIRQIVERTLRPGDRVHIVPFAATVDKPIAIEYGGQEDEAAILDEIPLQTNTTRRNTDIQQAEWFVYRYLAAQNQDRLQEQRPIKPQSVVWITDAPLETASGEDWIETPRNSPFRDANSLESRQRSQWLTALPRQTRSLTIESNKGEAYTLTVVDIAPTVQEVCTPAPGGRENCLVNDYLLSQLWLPGTIILGSAIAALAFFKTWWSWQQPWRLSIVPDARDEDDPKMAYLKSGERFTIGGEDGMRAIASPDLEVKAYLERRGNTLLVRPCGEIELNGRRVKKNKRSNASAFA